MAAVSPSPRSRETTALSAEVPGAPPVYSRFLRRDGSPVLTRLAIDPRNLSFVQDRITANELAYQRAGCDAVLATLPQRSWRHPTAGWERRLYENWDSWGNDWVFGAQELLWLSAAGALTVLGLGAIVYHSTPSQGSSMLRRFLDRPLEFLADGTALLFGLAAASSGVGSYLKRAHSRFEGCLELRDRLRDFRDIEAAIKTGQQPTEVPDNDIPDLPVVPKGFFEVIPLPQDIGLGTTAAVDAALTTGGSGVLDWVMIGLAAVGVAIAAPEIAIPRAAAAGWRLAAGAL